jgi:hypothetical protein
MSAFFREVKQIASLRKGDRDRKLDELSGRVSS